MMCVSFMKCVVLRRSLKSAPRSKAGRSVAGKLTIARMGRGFAWLDTGTFDSLIEAGCFMRTLEQRQGMKICCPEEIAYNMGYISQSRVKGLARSLRKSGYGTYLENPR